MTNMATKNILKFDRSTRNLDRLAAYRERLKWIHDCKVQGKITVYARQCDWCGLMRENTQEDQ